MRIAVIGAGALGLYYGALLQRAGHAVRFLLRRDFAAVTAHGLRVTSPRGDFHLPKVAGFRSSREIGQVDLVLVGVKAYDNPALPDLVRPLVGPETLLLTLQNGLGNEELLAQAFGPERIIGGVAFLCCNRGEPGVVHHLDQGAIRLAEFDRSDLKRLQALAAMFAAADIPCEACADLVRMRWEKLVWNIPFNGLCALTGLPTDRLLTSAGMRALVTEIMAEVIRAANVQGLREPIPEQPFVAGMLEATAGMGAYRPSMMIDRQAGRPLELAAIYQRPLQRAEQQGRPMPRVGMLLALLQATETGKNGERPDQGR